jgi:hypothetical protein
MIDRFNQVLSGIHLKKKDISGFRKARHLQVAPFGVGPSHGIRVANSHNCASVSVEQNNMFNERTKQFCLDYGAKELH